MIKPINLVSVAIISPTLGSIKNKHEQKDEAVYNINGFVFLLQNGCFFLNERVKGLGFININKSIISI